MDSESLLPQSATTEAIKCTYGNIGNMTRRRKRLFLLILALFLATCLAIYIYLNSVAFDSNQPDPARFKPLSRRRPMLDHESIFSDSGPSMIRLSDLLAHCIVALQIAGREVVELSLLKQNQIDHVGSKGKTLEGADDIVTGVDLRSHKMIVNTIKDSYRRLKVVSEEDTTKAFENVRPEDDLLPIGRGQFANMLRDNLGVIEKQHGDQGTLIVQQETLVWIDPLDATKEYSENLTEYVTLMACIVHKSTPIAGVIHKPFTNQTFWSLKDESSGQTLHSPDLIKLFDIRRKNHEDSIKIIVSRSHAGNVESKLKDIYGDIAQVVQAGGSGYKTIQLIGGSADAYVHMTHIKKWDICGPQAIMNSISGGIMTDLKGAQISFGDPKDKIVTGGLIATFNTTLYDRMIEFSSEYKI